MINIDKLAEALFKDLTLDKLDVIEAMKAAVEWNTNKMLEISLSEEALRKASENKEAWEKKVKKSLIAKPNGVHISVGRLISDIKKEDMAFLIAFYLNEVDKKELAKEKIAEHDFLRKVDEADRGDLDSLYAGIV